jgi:hypothetical protein
MHRVSVSAVMAYEVNRAAAVPLENVEVIIEIIVERSQFYWIRSDIPLRNIGESAMDETKEGKSKTK